MIKLSPVSVEPCEPAGLLMVCCHPDFGFRYDVAYYGDIANWELFCKLHSVVAYIDIEKLLGQAKVLPEIKNFITAEMTRNIEHFSRVAKLVLGGSSCGIERYLDRIYFLIRVAKYINLNTDDIKKLREAIDDIIGLLERITGKIKVRHDKLPAYREQKQILADRIEIINSALERLNNASCGF
jgi:hypothetical protein